jgi:hypothetical protein
MRLLIVWIVLAGLAAVSRWVAAPAVRAWSEKEVAGYEGGGVPPLAATIIGPFLGGFLEWMLPLLLLAGAVSVTVTWISTRLRRRVA